MKPPIIVYENGDVSIFASVEDVKIDLEPIDVENNIYVAYDSEGRLLSLAPTSPRITIQSAEQEPSHADELHAILFEFLLYVGLPAEWLRQASLQELVERAMEYKIDFTRHPFESTYTFFKRLFGRAADS
ncbi:MAG: hypothetical protein ACRD9R_16515 [Pyrinomonadaceae bacterium]